MTDDHGHAHRGLPSRWNRHPAYPPGFGDSRRDARCRRALGSNQVGNAGRTGDSQAEPSAEHEDHPQLPADGCPSLWDDPLAQRRVRRCPIPRMHPAPRHGEQRVHTCSPRGRGAPATVIKNEPTGRLRCSRPRRLRHGPLRRNSCGLRHSRVKNGPENRIYEVSAVSRWHAGRTRPCHVHPYALHPETSTTGGLRADLTAAGEVSVHVGGRGR